MMSSFSFAIVGTVGVGTKTPNVSGSPLSDSARMKCSVFFDASHTMSERSSENFAKLPCGYATPHAPASDACRIQPTAATAANASLAFMRGGLGLPCYRRGVKSRFLVVGLLAFSMGGCNSCHGPAGKGMKVAVSIFPLYDLTRRVAGPDAETILVLPPGHTEHSFDPTPKDVEQVAAAKVGVLVGLGLDPWMEKLMKDASPKAALVKVGEKVKTLTVKEGA